MNKSTLIFDWGDTIMRDLGLNGPMNDWERVEWVAGAQEMLQIVNPHFLCCIATSASHSDKSEMIAALARVGADKYFHHFFSSSELRLTKPNPEFFSEIIKLLGAEASECISIGNLYIKDIAPAKAAGLTTIWFNEHRQRGKFPKADHIINTWDELPSVLNIYRNKIMPGLGNGFNT
jgi:beta-phosphoglucomutase-like phosphatase (HAD superfamily)